MLDPLFAEQDELLREAERMGYEAVVPASPPAEPASAPLAADDAGQTQQVEVQGEDVAISSTSSMQSLLGKRNLLRSRLRGEQSANAAPARVTPVKPVAATKPAPDACRRDFAPGRGATSGAARDAGAGICHANGV